MKFGIFAVENVLEGLSNAVFAFPTNQAAAVSLAAQCPHPDEYRIFRIADYNPETREITPIAAELVPMDFRRVKSISRPETVSSDSSAFTEFVQKKDE